jgi:hypothetical protein
MRALLLAGLCALGAAEGNPPLPPQAQGAPLAPEPERVDQLTSEERLQRQLEANVRERDERIQAILRAHTGLRPVASGSLGAGLERPARERQQALEDLRQALDEYLGRTHRGDKDVLDAAGAARQSKQQPPLAAANRIAVAGCLQELASAEGGDERLRALADGLAELDALNNEMPDELRPRAQYLRVWFLAELARSPGEAAERADQAARARAAAADFSGSWPDSELIPAIAALVADLKP